MAIFLYNLMEVLAGLVFIGIFFGVATFVVVTGVALREAVRSGTSVVKIRILNRKRLRHGQFSVQPEQHRISRAFVR
jgi:hypothetical protein